jgi:ribosomal protein S9
MIGMVDVEATVAGGGPSGQSGAIRWGIACGLRSFVSQDMVEKMRIGKIKWKILRIHIFSVKYAIRKVKKTVKTGGLELNGTHQLLVCDDDYWQKHKYKETHRSSIRWQ